MVGLTLKFTLSDPTEILGIKNMMEEVIQRVSKATSLCMSKECVDQREMITTVKHGILVSKPQKDILAQRNRQAFLDLVIADSGYL